MNFKHLIVLSLVISSCITSRAETGLRYIKPDKQTGTSKAVVTTPQPLAHTTQLLPVNHKGEIVGKGDIAKQTEQVLKNLEAALKAGQSSLKQIVKLNVYIARADLHSAVTKVLAKTFSGDTKPAVTFVGGDLRHPDALVAMDAVAVSTYASNASAVNFFSSDSLEGDHVHVSVLPKNGGIYVAGMADKNELAEATRVTLEKLKGAIRHFGLGLEDVVQLKAFMTPMSKADVVEAEIRNFFGNATMPPTVYVDWVASSVPIEIELIAVAPRDNAPSTNTVTYITPPGTTASASYSRVARIHSGNRIYISGLYGRTTPENDVKDIYGELESILKETGSDMKHLVKATYYFSDPASNGRLDALRPKIYDPKRPPSASKSRAKDVGMPGKGITIDMIAVTSK